MGLAPRAMVCLHGFMGCGADLREFAEAMGGWEVFTPDLPWHGGGFGGRDFSRELVEWLDARAVREACLLGYSMGGRIGLRAAMDFPEVFPVFVGVSTTAGIVEPDERAARRQQDAQLAARLRSICGQDEFRSFLREWWAMDVFGGAREAGMEEFVESRLRHDAKQLAECLEHWGAGTLEPVWEGLAGYPGRALFVGGELDVKYTGLARRMADAVPLGKCAAIAGAGHRLPNESPRALARVVSDWLDGGAGLPFRS